MDTNQYLNLDKLLRYLYSKGGESPWNEVYETVGIDREEAKWLYEICHADGYIEVKDKGGIKRDDHTVGFTKLGLSWFSKTNYENEFIKKQDTAGKIYQNISISHSTVDKLNAGVNSKFEEILSHSTKSFWKNPWVIGIGTGVIVAIIIWLFNLK